MRWNSGTLGGLCGGGLNGPPIDSRRSTGRADRKAVVILRVTIARVAGISVDRSPEGSPHGSTARPNGAVRVWACGGAAVLGLILSVGWARTTEPAKSAVREQAFWRVGKPVPIAVRQGRATFRAPAASPGSELLVVVSALSRETGPFSIKLAARPAKIAAIPAIADDGVPACGKTCLREQRPREATERARAHVDPAKRAHVPHACA